MLFHFYFGFPHSNIAVLLDKCFPFLFYQAHIYMYIQKIFKNIVFATDALLNKDFHL